MTRHSHDDGRLAEGIVDYDYVVHREDGTASLLVVGGVPASICDVCDEYWFDEEVGFALVRLLEERTLEPGEVRRIEWSPAHAA
jgi:YgiT-type zinc finger domain-containing protein